MVRTLVLTLALSLAVSCVTPSAGHRGPASQDMIVAIFGDIHEDFDSEEKMLAMIKEAGATHIVGLGDFIEWKGIPALQKALEVITPLTGVAKNKIYLAPGNWEQTLNNPADVNRTLLEYGDTLILQEYDKAEVFEIDGHRVRGGHFPQYQIPDDLLPPRQAIHRIPGQVTLVETLARNDHPHDVELDLFAHTHVGGMAFDKVHQIWSLNPGIVGKSGRKRDSEPQGFALWYVNQGIVKFINVVTAEVQTFNLNGDACRDTPCTFWNK